VEYRSQPNSSNASTEREKGTHLIFPPTLIISRKLHLECIELYHTKRFSLPIRTQWACQLSSLAWRRKDSGNCWVMKLGLPAIPWSTHWLHYITRPSSDYLGWIWVVWSGCCSGSWRGRGRCSSQRWRRRRRVPTLRWRVLWHPYLLVEVLKVEKSWEEDEERRERRVVIPTRSSVNSPKSKCQLENWFLRFCRQNYFYTLETSSSEVSDALLSERTPPDKVWAESWFAFFLSLASFRLTLLSCFHSLFDRWERMYIRRTWAFLAP